MTEDCRVYETVTPKDLAEQIVKQLMTRAGEVVTFELALERARNIAQGLVDTMVTNRERP